MEQANAVNQRFDPFSNTYNPGWRSHPNFGWRGNQAQGQSQGQFNQSHGQFHQGQGQYNQGQYGQNQFGYGQGSSSQGQYGQGHAYNQNQHGPSQAQYQRPPGFNGPRPNQFTSPNAPPPPQKTSLETMLETFISTSSKENSELRESVKQMQTHNKMLESQIAQLATAFKEGSKTKLPSQGENPREHANAIVTQSGKELREGEQMRGEKKNEVARKIEIERKESGGGEKRESGGGEKKKAKMRRKDLRGKKKRKGKRKRVKKMRVVE